MMRPLLLCPFLLGPSQQDHHTLGADWRIIIILFNRPPTIGQLLKPSAHVQLLFFSRVCCLNTYASLSVMERLPQECRDIVASFLAGYDVKNLVLVSKRYYDFFVARNLRRLWFQGLPRFLSHLFTSFLAMRQFSLIRRVTIHLEHME